MRSKIVKNNLQLTQYISELLTVLEALLQIYHNTNVTYRHDYEKEAAAQAHAIIIKVRKEVSNEI